MADGGPTAKATMGAGGRGLTYPCGGPPTPGQAVTVAPGVLWLRFDLPFSLNHVNVWALEDAGGWTVIDTGLNTPPTVQAWEAALAGPLAGRPVTRLICTHMHPDHIGLAGWLCARFDAPLLITRLEYVTGRMLLADTGRPAPEAGARFYHRAGWSAEQVDRYRAEFGGFGKAVAPLPDAYHRLEHGDVLTIGGQAWRIVVGSGHSPEHACLLRESDGVFVAGDQVLPRISSNISIWPTEPLADPLADWLESLTRLRADLSPDLLVLPSHGEPFTGLHERLEALLRGHEVSLKRLRKSLAEPRRAIDVFSALFGRPVGEGLMGMATGESLAHLNYLTRRDLAVCEPDADGVLWWTTTDAPMEPLT